MQCRICGASEASFQSRSGMTLCQTCAKSTPRKVDRETFDRVYWEGRAADVPLSTRNEFWDDYHYSTHGNVASYISVTRSVCE